MVGYDTGVISGAIEPLMDAKDPWFVKYFKRALPFNTCAFFRVVLILVAWRLVPETKARPLEEIDIFLDRGHADCSAAKLNGIFLWRLKPQAHP